MDKSSRLTPAQLEFFNLLIDFRRREGVFPSTREIVQLSGFRSPRSVSQFFDALEKAGYVQRLPGARNVRILRHPQANSSADRTETIRVPIVGHVAAGLPILAEENIEDYIDVSRNLARGSSRYFALRVRGDSMNVAGIEDGDLVLVREQPNANAGEKIVALIDDSATVKIFRPGSDAILLEPQSSNPGHLPIVVERDFRIQGVVIATIPQNEHNTK